MSNGFKHLKKDLTQLTRWPGKKDGETYAQTKARLKETPAMEAALRQAPATYWGLTQETILEAFVPEPIGLNTPGRMPGTYIRRLGRLARDGFVDAVTAAEFLMLRGGNEGMKEALSMSAKGVLTTASTTRGFAVSNLLLITTDLKKRAASASEYEVIRTIRKAHPDLVTDEFIIAVAGQWAQYLGEEPSDGNMRWDFLRAMRAGLMLLRTLPNWREMKAIAQVHGS